MNTRAIIICAGEATRWGNYLNTRKHLITLEGEIILHRTVRLLRERGIEDIHIIVKDDDMIEKYRTEGAKLTIAKLNPENVDADKFLSSRDHWEENGRTILIYGDTYLSEECMDKIVGYDSTDIHFFGRFDASALTGTPWGELFAISVYAFQLEKFEACLKHVAEAYKSGKITRCGGWELYRCINGQPDDKLRKHVRLGHFTEVDDWSDDFDYPKDYDSWIANRARFLETQK